MGCPYNIPLEAYYGTLSQMWIVKDTEGKVIFFDLTETQAECIVQAINCHEKFKIACGRAYEGLSTNDLDACDKAIELLDEVMKEAEKS